MSWLRESWICKRGELLLCRWKSSQRQSYQSGEIQFKTSHQQRGLPTFVKLPNLLEGWEKKTVKIMEKNSWQTSSRLAKQSIISIWLNFELFSSQGFCLRKKVKCTKTSFFLFAFAFVGDVGFNYNRFYATDSNIQEIRNI